MPYNRKASGPLTTRRQSTRARSSTPLAQLVLKGLAERGLRPSTAADAAGIKRSHLSHVTRRGKGLSAEKLVALADVLHIRRDEMLRAAGVDTALPIGGPNASSFVLTRLATELRLPVVTDPRFVDSALFLWILNTQPFASFNIWCDFITCDWHSVPGTVEDSHAIGFYNRRASTTPTTSGLYNTDSYADLCVYKGYAVLARPGELDRPLNHHKDADEFLQSLVSKNGRPIVITIGGDTLWRCQTQINPLFDAAHFEVLVVENPDKALEKFTGGRGHLFVGGLPQRLAAKKEGCHEVISFKNNPLLYSVNSLVFERGFLGNTSARAVMNAITSLWFDTISRLKEDTGFRDRVCTEIPTLLETLGYPEHNVKPDVLRLVLPGTTDSEGYEVFPTKPAEILHTITDITEAIIGTMLGDEILLGRASALLEDMQKFQAP